MPASNRFSPPTQLRKWLENEHEPVILICAGERSERAFDAMLQLAVQLDQAGHSACIDARFLPEHAHRYQKFEAALYLCDPEDVTARTVLMIGADRITDDVQTMLRALDIPDQGRVYALGRFSDHDALIRAQNKLAYALGQEAEVINLISEQGETALIEDTIAPFITAIAPKPTPPHQPRPCLMVYVPATLLEDSTTLPDLAALGHSALFDLHIVTTGNGKALIRQSRYANLSVFGNSDLPPDTLMSYADIVAVLGPTIPGARMAQFALMAMAAGKPVIDGTENAQFLAKGAPALEGPTDVAGLAGYLETIVLPHLSEIGHRTLQSPWLAKFDLAKLEQQTGLIPHQRPTTDQPGGTVFFPTNGNGLGHAQRCSLIAKEMSPDSAIRFAAFPSCVGLLKGRGFDCLPMVQRSEELVEEYANDLINYRRLSGLIKAGDQFVFDGGYVFDSIYRVISTHQLPAVWIRRGLWQPGQINANALEREHIFSKVIVPMEGFDELNTDYSYGDRVHRVGPIVNTTKRTDQQRNDLRADLSKLFDKPVDTLVVSMLGGGVASDRSVQTQMLCSTLERRKNCLHLVLAWPNAVVPDGVYGWNNTRVVQTHGAAELCHAADVTVSAAGYNSFHELVYAGAPTIFIPQSAPYLDDQEKRARAAADRGLAILVQETELMTLSREVNAFLDEGKSAQISAAHAEQSLPAPGNRAAAALIEGRLPA